MVSSQAYGPELYGLTGGMGSGKTTAAEFFRDIDGVTVLDADKIVRELQEPGQPLLEEMATILGDHIIVDGELDRKAAATIMFSDPEKNEAVKGLVLPALHQRFEDEAKLAWESEFLMFDAPLLDPAMKIGGRALDGIVVIDVPVEVAIARLEGRGFTEQEARARLDLQISRQQRNELATFKITNTKTPEELKAHVMLVHEQMKDRKRALGHVALAGAV